MVETSNAVLTEQIKQLRKDVSEHKKNHREEMKELEKEVNEAKSATNTLNITMDYVKETVSDMRELMNTFVEVQDKQNKTINDFMTSDKRMSQRKQIIVSILQVAGGILITILGILGYGKL